MGAFTVLAMVGVNAHSFALFLGSYLGIFLLSGAGNGSTYRMIPVIFGELGRKEAAEKGVEPSATALTFKREAAAVIGIAGAIGAFGGFLIQLVFRQASLSGDRDWSTSALWVFLAAYVIFAFLTWFYYLRRSFAVARVPSLAHAGV
jgi:NNP family nitrate/nitrite transporter-like MFS transporter